MDATLSDVTGAQHAGITLLERRRVHTPVCSSELVRKVDQEQYRTSEGPCLQAAREQVPHIRVDDLRNDATSADPFTEDSLHLGGLLAAHAAVGLAATRRELNLQIALASRDVIGQAKGILMERFKIDSHEAFNLLVAVSQHTQRKLRDIADELATTGQLRGLE